VAGKEEYRSQHQDEEKERVDRNAEYDGHYDDHQRYENVEQHVPNPFDEPT
jgi:hypothetical protein